MKTFETEKHNIPEGATHYRDECEHELFMWIKYQDEKMLIWSDTYWYFEGNIDSVKPIPQTNIETPEEKEALDLIDTTPQQYESVASKEVEWVNGDFAIYEGSVVMVIAYHPKHPVIVVETSTEEYINVGICDLSKPEAKQQREEREREENGKAFYEDMSKIEVSVMNPEDHGEPNPWSELRDEWQEVYILQAEALNYKKEG